MTFILDQFTGAAPFCIPIAALLGIIGLVSTFALSGAAKNTTNWPSTRGQVLSCRTVVTQNRTRTRAGTIDTGKTYHVEILYSYVVDGQEYTGSQFRVGQSQIEVTGLRDGERLSSKFKSQPQVDVFYNPQKPQEAVLARGRNEIGEVRGLFLGLLMLGTAVFMFFYYRPYGF
jgi:hypothetical protein